MPVVTTKKPPIRVAASMPRGPIRPIVSSINEEEIDRGHRRRGGDGEAVNDGTWRTDDARPRPCRAPWPSQLDHVGKKHLRVLKFWRKCIARAPHHLQARCGAANPASKPG